MGPTPLPQTVQGHPLEGHNLVELPVGKKQQSVAGYPTRVRTTNMDCAPSALQNITVVDYYSLYVYNPCIYLCIYFFSLNFLNMVGF